LNISKKRKRVQPRRPYQQIEMQSVKRLFSSLFSSKEGKKNDRLQWIKLESKNSDALPLVIWWRRIFISLDHMIVLVENSNQVYTFNLRDLLWSKHTIKKQSKEFMGFSSCIVRPGLIIDLVDSTLKLLTFDTDKGSFIH